MQTGGKGGEEVNHSTRKLRGAVTTTDLTGVSKSKGININKY